jgi:predicted dehydrogenase
MPKQSKIDRRGFLKRAGVAAGALALPTIIPSAVWGANGSITPSNRVALGLIGVGVMGTGHLGGFLGTPEAEVVAICDVKRDRRDTARDRVNQTYNKTGCATYNDFREMLARPEIDAVCIATNDHWHVLHALQAVQQGKDVYLEKPMGLSIREIQTLREAVQRSGRVFQFGTQRRSFQHFHHACNLVRNGRVGRIRSIDVGVHSGAAERTGLKTFKPAAIPEGFDYDFWLGPAPTAPFIPQRVINPHWFHVSDYSLGYVGGWGIHYIDIAQWGNDTEHTGPVEIDGTAVYPYDDALCTAVHRSPSFSRGFQMLLLCCELSELIHVGLTCCQQRGQ